MSDFFVSAGMSVASLQRLCACVAAPGVSAPLWVLKLGPPADSRLDMGFVTSHLLPMLGVRHSSTSRWLSVGAAVVSRRRASNESGASCMPHVNVAPHSHLPGLAGF